LEKAADAFRTISEVADEIKVPQHVLRFWESRFTQIRPMKRGGGRRYYRPDDVDLLRGIRHLLYGEGYTIRGVQRILREQGSAFVQNVWRVGAEPPPPMAEDDRAEDEIELTAGEARPEPDLSAFGLASRNHEHADRERSAKRRKPPISAAASVPRDMQQAIAAGERNKLQTAIDELVACRRLIEAVLSEDGASDDEAGAVGRSAEI
jgi:DNA-binding transcriptional MerR regulator